MNGSTWNGSMLESEPVSPRLREPQLTDGGQPKGLSPQKSKSILERPKSIYELCASANIKLRRPPSRDLAFDALLPIIYTLLEMRRAGMLAAIWIDNVQLRVQCQGSKERHRLSWKAAERLTRMFLSRGLAQ